MKKDNVKTWIFNESIMERKGEANETWNHNGLVVEKRQTCLLKAKSTTRDAMPKKRRKN